MWMTVRYDQVMTVMRGALHWRCSILISVTHSRQLVPLRAQTSRSAPGNSSKI